jgi:flagellar biosynthetic protein FliR
MDVDIDLAVVLSIFLLSLRLGVLLVLTPVFSNLTRLTTIRVMFTLALSVTLIFGLGLPKSVVPLSLGAVLVASVMELVLGAILAFGVFAAFGVFSVAGKILDIQSGFGLGSVFDPVTRAGAPIFATMLNLLALAVFFGLDGHHALMRGMAFSAQQIPPGSVLSSLPVEAVIGQFGLMFSLAIALIAPVVFCLFLIEAGMAMTSRMLPQMNILVIGVTVKIVVGLIVFAISMGTILPVMGRIYASIFTYWEQVLR